MSWIRLNSLTSEVLEGHEKGRSMVPVMPAREVDGKRPVPYVSHIPTLVNKLAGRGREKWRRMLPAMSTLDLLVGRGREKWRRMVPAMSTLEVHGERQVPCVTHKLVCRGEG
jgi:hypothetical protein